MTLIYDRQVDTPHRAHAFVLGIGRFPHLSDKDIKTGYDSAVKFIEFLVRSADQFNHKLATIECLLSDPDKTPNPGGVQVDELPKCDPQHDPRADTKVDAATLPNVQRAADDWIDRCEPGDLIIFYGCSHGVAERDQGGLLVLEDVLSSRNNPWNQLLDVHGMASFLPAKKRGSDVWVFLDACQEVIPNLVQTVGGATPYLPVTATVVEQAKPQVRDSFTLAGSKFGGFAKAPKKGGVAYFTEALLHGLEKSCVERIQNNWSVTGKELLFGLDKVSFAAYGTTVTPKPFRGYNEDGILLHVKDPEFPVLVRTIPEKLMKSATDVGLHRPNTAGQPVVSRNNNKAPQWRCSVKPNQAPLELHIDLPVTGKKTQPLIMKPPAIIMEVDPNATP